MEEYENRILKERVNQQNFKITNGRYRASRSNYSSLNKNLNNSTSYLNINQTRNKKEVETNLNIWLKKPYGLPR